MCIRDRNARIELWEQGQLDIFTPNGDTLETYIDDPRLVEYGSNSVFHIDINCKNPNNPISGSDNYRKAIYHALAVSYTHLYRTAAPFIG